MEIRGWYWAEEREEGGGSAAPVTNVEPIPPTEEEGQSAESAKDTEAEASSKQPQEAGKGRERLNKRFSELTRTIYDERSRREEAERENAELRSRFARAGGGGQPEREPKLADFKEYEEYADARSRWVARQEFRRAASAMRESSAREEAMTRASEIRSRWESSEASTREKFDDYDEVMAGPVRFPETVAIALLDSDRGPELSYYLKTHPDEVKALRGLTPVAAARVIGRLEAKLADEPARKDQPKAPPPPRPNRPTAPVDELRDNLSDSEWIRRRNKQELDRRRNG